MGAGYNAQKEKQEARARCHDSGHRSAREVIRQEPSRGEADPTPLPAVTTAKMSLLWCGFDFEQRYTMAIAFAMGNGPHWRAGDREPIALQSLAPARCGRVGSARYPNLRPQGRQSPC